MNLRDTSDNQNKTCNIITGSQKITILKGNDTDISSTAYVPQG